MFNVKLTITMIGNSIVAKKISLIAAQRYLDQKQNEWRENGGVITRDDRTLTVVSDNGDKFVWSIEKIPVKEKFRYMFG